MSLIQTFPSGGSAEFPSGGTTGQALVKHSNADNDVEWANQIDTQKTIKDNGTAVTDRDTLNFIDFDISDDSTDEETDIKAHRLTAGEMAEIMSTLPGAVSDMPVLFDETGTERVVGWYKLANGTKQPVYRKDYACGAGPNNTTKMVAVGFELTAIHIIDLDMIAWNPTTGGAHKLSYQSTDIYYIKDNYINIQTSVDRRSFNFYASLYYTKNSDTPV